MSEMGLFPQLPSWYPQNSPTHTNYLLNRILSTSGPATIPALAGAPEINPNMARQLRASFSAGPAPLNIAPFPPGAPMANPSPIPRGIQNVNPLASAGATSSTPAAAGGLAARARGLGGGLALGLGYQFGGQFGSQLAGGNDTTAGSAIGAAGHGGTAGLMLGGVLPGVAAAPFSAAAAAGLGIGEAIGRGTGLGSLTNIPENLQGPGSLLDRMPDLEARGIKTSDLVQWLTEPNGDDILATALANAHVDGAERDGQGGIDIKGDALGILESFSAASNPDSDDSFGRFLREMAANRTPAEEVDLATGVFAEAMAAQAATGEDPDPDEAIAQTRDLLDQMRNEAQAQDDYLTRALELQQVAQSYMAPVTGQMREQADANYSMVTGMLGTMNLPPGMAQAITLQADAARQQQMATAAAYDNQIAVAQPAAALQDYTTRVEGIAGQIDQQMQAAQIQQMMGGMGGNPLATLGL